VPSLPESPLGGTRSKVHDRHLIYVDHVEEHCKEFFTLTSNLGLEGIVGKDKRSLYVSGRETRDWLKIKNPDFQRKSQ
jgi:ATP-dependent DNA ligase